MATMRKLIALIMLGTSLVFFGCVPGEKQAEAPAPHKRLLKCSTCGKEFTTPEALTHHEEETGHQ